MYQVTATRRRPQTFDQLLGQEFVSATLKKSIEAGKIAHAYLFSGPRGCGKTSTARILAKALNCKDGPTANPCGTCESCMQITAGSSFDVIEIDGASNTGVDDVRKIKDEILFPPNASRYKVYIIDEVHMLSTNAFNALLKTIEEPPPYVVFIFATTELHKVPATIKSRCQQFNFRLVDIQTLHDALKDACTEQGITADDEALFWIAREATGSVRDCYTLFDQVASFSDGNITLEKIQDKLGLTAVERINELVTACVKKNANDALMILHECLNSGVSVEQFTIDCTKYFRTCLLIKHGITKESILGQSAARFSIDVLQGWETAQLERALALMLQLYKDIHLSVNPAYELELAISRLSWLSDYVPPDQLKDAYTKLKEMFSKKKIENTDNHSDSITGMHGTSAAHAAVRQFQPVCGTVQQEASNQGTAYNQSTPAAAPNNTTVLAGNTAAAGASAASDQAAPEKKYTLAEAKTQLVKDYAAESSVIAAALDETINWELSENILTVATEKIFHKDTLEKHSADIVNRLNAYLHKTPELHVQLLSAETSQAASADKPPEKVKQIMQLFQADLLEVTDTASTADNEN